MVQEAKEIPLEEKLGYFDADQNGVYLGYSYPTLYPCKECHSAVLSTSLDDHIRWHLGCTRSDEEMYPHEIQDAARRELGRVHRGL